MSTTEPSGTDFDGIGVRPALQRLIQEHRLAFGAVLAPLRACDEVERGEEITAEDERRCDEAVKVEDGLLLELCAYPCIGKAELAAKGRYLLDHRERNDLSDEQQDALLRSMCS